MKLSISYIIILMQCYFLCSCDHIQKKQITTNSQESIPISNLKWKNKIYDFQKVRQDTIITARYTFYNTCDKDLIIQYVNPDCNCTTYQLSKKMIPVNDSAYIELSLNTKNKIGKQHLYTTIKANTKAQMYKLILKGYVEHH